MPAPACEPCLGRLEALRRRGTNRNAAWPNPSLEGKLPLSVESRTENAMSQNLLSQETSPYLLLHKDNPVHWRPWGAAALAEAEAPKKPILLSVGYTACHWCHVMNHESFADAETAGLMNERFVNIKVDREERPDIDQIYQVAANAMG